MVSAQLYVLLFHCPWKAAKIDHNPSPPLSPFSFTREWERKRSKVGVLEKNNFNCLPPLMLLEMLGEYPLLWVISILWRYMKILGKELYVCNNDWSVCAKLIFVNNIKYRMELNMRGVRMNGFILGCIWNRYIHRQTHCNIWCVYSFLKTYVSIISIL